MKKDQDPIERLAFHLITYRDVASSVANDGLRCEQLSFPIQKYLGNLFKIFNKSNFLFFEKVIRRMVFIYQDVQMFS
jgi:hypothetical protein